MKPVFDKTVFQWIPEKLPSNVTLVLSTSHSSDVLKILQHRNDLIQKSLKPLDIWLDFLASKS